jgi:integrase
MHGSMWRREETRASRASTCRAAQAPLADPTKRHTFGTRCAAAGVPLRTLQAWMGHADIKTTMVYTHYAPGANEAELVNGVFQREGIKEGIKLSTTAHDADPQNPDEMRESV